MSKLRPVLMHVLVCFSLLLSGCFSSDVECSAEQACDFGEVCVEGQCFRSVLNLLTMSYGIPL